eukprot:4531509-Prymnesium_polylepis.1
MTIARCCGPTCVGRCSPSWRSTPPCSPSFWGGRTPGVTAPSRASCGRGVTCRGTGWGVTYPRHSTIQYGFKASQLGGSCYPMEIPVR